MTTRKSRPTEEQLAASYWARARTLAEDQVDEPWGNPAGLTLDELTRERYDTMRGPNPAAGMTWNAVIPHPPIPEDVLRECARIWAEVRAEQAAERAAEHGVPESG